MKLFFHFSRNLMFFYIITIGLYNTSFSYSQNYCWPNTQMACFYGDLISNVTFAGINHTDNVCSSDPDGKKDFTGTVSPAQVTINQAYLLSVSVENSIQSGTERVRAWIDFNKNYIFESNESFDLGVGTGNTTLTANINIPSNAVIGTTRMRIMYRRTSSNPLNAEDACHSYGSYRGQVKDYAVTINSNSTCTGALNPGNTISSVSSACPGENFVLSLQNTVSGTTYQWQSSLDGSIWTNITGATSSTFSTSQNTATFYKCIVTCQGNTGSSNSLLVNSNGPVYTTLPVTESFENWSNMCGQITNVPSNYWAITPATGNSSWRRNDQGASAGWNNVNTGIYTPQASHQTYSARFHTVGTANNTQGSMDLYVNCNAGNPTKKLSFDYINTDGNDVLSIFLSTDGGQNFVQIGNTIGISTGWINQTHTFNTSSSTVIVRLSVTSDNQSSDIGIDNLNLQTVQICNAPSNLAVSGLTSVSATINWSAAIPTPVAGYEYVLSTSNNLPVGNGTPISTTNYNAVTLAQNLNYYFFVRAACGGNLFSDWEMIHFITTVVECPDPGSIHITAITANAATINWTAPTPAPADGYEYYISTTNNPPSGSGTFVNTNSVIVSGLPSNKTHYVFVRSKCSNGNFSNWRNAFFTTKGTSGIEEVAEAIGLILFPNPAYNEIHIEAKTSSQINQLVVSDLTGKVILIQKGVSSKETLLLNPLSQGSYLLKIDTDKGTFTRQFHIVR